jgi:hypothetical protein
MKTTVLPDATREEMLAAAGLDGSARWDIRDELDYTDLDEVFAAGSWHIVDAKNSEDERGGLTAHRGVLAPEEAVDLDVLRPMVEDALGFTYAEIAAAYREGRPSKDTLQLRARIDARLLELSRSGGNMIELAKALGWPIEVGARGERSSKMARALARARQAEGS